MSAAMFLHAVSLLIGVPVLPVTVYCGSDVACVADVLILGATPEIDCGGGQRCIIEADATAREHAQDSRSAIEATP